MSRLRFCTVAPREERGLRSWPPARVPAASGAVSLLGLRRAWRPLPDNGRVLAAHELADHVARRQAGAIGERAEHRAFSGRTSQVEAVGPGFGRHAPAAYTRSPY